MPLKFKIVSQTKENVNDIIIPLTQLKKKKWKYLLKKRTKKKKKWKYLSYKQKKDVQKKKKEEEKNLIIKPIKLKTFYKQRLISYRKFNYFYGILKNKQLKKQYNLLKKKIYIKDRLLENLEKRLDICLFRTTLFKTLFEIHQLINHKKIKVNWKYIKSKNFLLTVGDYIYICPKLHNFRIIELPKYLEWNEVLNLLCIFKQPVISNFSYSFLFDKNFIIDFIKKY